jgi:hypothetical protein
MHDKVCGMTGWKGDSKGVGDCQKNELQAKNTKKRFGVEVKVVLKGI